MTLPRPGARVERTPEYKKRLREAEIYVDIDAAGTVIGPHPYSPNPDMLRVRWDGDDTDQIMRHQLIQETEL